MIYEELIKSLGTLEDVQFGGFSWSENDLRLGLIGPGNSNYSAIICHWAYSLVVKVSWEDPRHKRSGPMLSMGGHLNELPENEFELLIDFGANNYLSVKCSHLTLVT